MCGVVDDGAVVYGGGIFLAGAAQLRPATEVH